MRRCEDVELGRCEDGKTEENTEVSEVRRRKMWSWEDQKNTIRKKLLKVSEIIEKAY